jgi:2'-5' RNA ligase
MELSDSARRHLARVQASLRAQLPDASYPPAENLHVTLKFLGEANDQQIPAICEGMRDSNGVGSLTLMATELSFFPSRAPARVIVASIAGSEQPIATLHDSIEGRCRTLGFAAETRQYHPACDAGPCLARGFSTDAGAAAGSDGKCLAGPGV